MEATRNLHRLIGKVPFRIAKDIFHNAAPFNTTNDVFNHYPNNPEGQKLLTRLEKKHDKGKALSILAHKLGRAVYYMPKRQTAFDMALFLQP